MPVEKITIEKFLALSGSHPVVDVRSPAEYAHAHIPGALNLPLFSNEERKVVGTAYKQESREAAIKIGLDYFGPKMRSMVEFTEALQSKTILVHCWRGGMRSMAVAWLLDLYGFKVYTLAGGYKKFRHFIIDMFEQVHHFAIVGGYTGSGKTELLTQLTTAGEIVIDLEALANHKGSAFGNLGMPPQPSQEQFENLLGLALHQANHKNGDTKKIIWLEDESQRIGTVNIPMPLWKQMRTAPLYFIDIPFEERLKKIVSWYGAQNKEKIAAAIQRIQKRLGGLETKTALLHLQEDRIADCFSVLLKYYDKWYNKSLLLRPDPEKQVKRITLPDTDTVTNMNALLHNRLTKQIQE